jgi:hypothetical protein
MQSHGISWLFSAAAWLRLRACVRLRAWLRLRAWVHVLVVLTTVSDQPVEHIAAAAGATATRGLQGYLSGFLTPQHSS